ncbi:hypothetical protein KIV40_32020 [Vibrio sp. D173a]|uniref:hypothetical protein n=1 Tax=unclassified Vibrio TaxID=2614977 RepID=UPI0025547656|nr:MULTISPECIES: hypothetical protein [unclassified Vibrio]MDK9739876.1 hypothetical protein [Vibrio sp. D404a]MDK9759814.1 hypothetical protein [Vibrio sp. D173a]MDK9799204.1 hypothetical protein [Vibrio sp. D449a]
MKKLIALGLMAISMNTAFASDGNYTGTIDMTLTSDNQVQSERIAPEPKLQGRNEASDGGVRFMTPSDKHEFVLNGRRD